MKKLFQNYFLPLLIGLGICIGLISPIIYYALLRIFVVGIYPVPSDSMQPAIIPGDVILVNKLKFGPRTFKNLDFLDCDTIPVDNIRFKGYGHIERNDVVVFNYPYADSWSKARFNYKEIFVKRCLGLPGDTIRIENGFYKVAGYDKILGNQENQFRLSQFPDEILNTIPGNRRKNGWTVKNYGPLYIPKAGDTISLDFLNREYYTRIIEWETGGQITSENGVYYLNGEIISQYTVQHSYYFMAGDKVSNSRDSRFWGLLQEEYIIGEAPLILYSKDTWSGHLRMDRILKSISL